MKRGGPGGTLSPERDDGGALYKGRNPSCRGCLWKERLLQEVDITQPSYTTRYPELKGFMDPQPEKERRNRARNNILVRCGELCGGNWSCAPDENWMTDEDPGFVDGQAEDFALKKNAEVFKRLQGFQPIPFGEIGLKVDALRPALPAIEERFSFSMKRQRSPPDG